MSRFWVAPLCAACLTLVVSSALRAQTVAVAPANPPVRPAATPSAASANSDAGTPTVRELEEVRQTLRQQQDELARMKALVEAQARVIEELRQRMSVAETRLAPAPNTPASAPASALNARNDAPNGSTNGLVITPPGAAANNSAANGASDMAQTGAQTSKPAPAQTPAQTTVEARLAKLEKAQEGIARQIGGINFSGDLRLRYEPTFGQQNILANGANPAVLGNELGERNRFRVRARFAMRGKIGNEFDWGVRLASGGFGDDISTNQTLTDFFNRKPFALDQAYIAWTPEKVKGLRLQAGKFEVPWLRTEMTLDNDLDPEGFSQTYRREFKNNRLQSVTFVAWQLPILERNAGFVRNANGTVNIDESNRAGRDLALYGAQTQLRFKTSKHSTLTLAAANLYYSGTQFISPVQVFGTTVQVPVSVTIPASGGNPAQVVTGTATISRDLLVAGNANLGLSNASTNNINRDGRLSSGYNLADFVGQLDITRSARWPVKLLLNVVRNTQTHDVIVAGTGGRNQFLKNNENMGYWAEFQTGRLEKRGDTLFNYTFIRIEKDAVLTPFNFSDIAAFSDIRVHRIGFSYAADPRVILAVTGLFSQRPNGLLGPFGITPPGSIDRTTSRLQFDTIFRF